MGLASRSKGVEKYRLRGSAKAVHTIAAIAAAANLLLVLFLLNGRIAADTILVVQGKLAPFEWVGKHPCDAYTYSCTDPPSFPNDLPSCGIACCVQCILWCNHQLYLGVTR